jgi:hypothetical protein
MLLTLRRVMPLVSPVGLVLPSAIYMEVRDKRIH